MKISFNWLKQYIPTELDITFVSDILTDIGLEVEKISKYQSIKGGLDGLVIGEVLTKEKHPNADKLNITTVDIGLEEPKQIVCGAPNVNIGQKVVVASPGTVLYTKDNNSFKIKKSKIRGVESLGMICSGDEIGIEDNSLGIMVLNPDVKVGTLASEYFEVENDFQIEIGLTPNRADAMGHIGIARDLLAALKYRHKEFKNIELDIPNTSNFLVDNTSVKLDVDVLDKNLCPRYGGLSINGVDVKESPKWLKNKLQSIGLTPVNNVVDVTNFVLHEYGQPLHAFDVEKIEGNKLVVKTLGSEVDFTTLDGVERKIHPEDLIINNANNPMCIAGVFGGLESGITEKTTSIFLESAYFNPISIRKTAKRHGLNTDASFRFERGVDSTITIKALKRAALLIQEIGGGKVSSEIIDIYPQKIENKKFKINKNNISSICGVEFINNEIENILKCLDIKILESDKNELFIEVPSYRVDVQREIDIAEEVLRIYGFNNVPIPEKLNSSISYRPKLDKEKHKEYISNWLSSIGYSETMSNSLTKDKYSEIINEKDRSVRLLNPLSSELNVLRQTLIFNTLETIKLNQNHGTENIKIFEFGNIYNKKENKFKEENNLCIAISGKTQEELWNSNNKDVSFYNIKGVLEGLLSRMGINKNTQICHTKNILLEDGLEYSIIKKKVADIGWVKKDIKDKLGLKSNVFVAIINWEAVLELTSINNIKFKELSKFPKVKRDLSLLLDNNVTFESIEKIAKRFGKKILKEVSLFDVYKDKSMEKDKKSYAIRLKLQDDNKTLNDAEVDKIMNKIQSTIIKELNAELR